eukprot:941062-Amphidinium_carterae.1
MQGCPNGCEERAHYRHKADKVVSFTSQCSHRADSDYIEVQRLANDTLKLLEEVGLGCHLQCRGCKRHRSDAKARMKLPKYKDLSALVP